MPWKETCRMDERIRFVAEWSKEETNFSVLCRAFGISRKTGYKWVERYELFGPEGLVDRPPIAKRHPNKIDEHVLDLVLGCRKGHPLWGPRKVRAWLSERYLEVRMPAASTIGEILKRYGMVRPRKRRLRVPFRSSPLDPCVVPNEVWCTDFKGDFLLGDRTRCYPLTIMDGHTRYLLRSEGLTSQKTAPVKRQFELVFEEFGLPERIRSDNGVPFATAKAGGLSRLSVWWIRLGIVPERIEPGHPEQNGRHERMHKTLKAHTAKPPRSMLSAQQRAFDLFRAEYNEERPHESLGQQPPARHYALSLREYHPALERSPEYDCEFKVRKVQSDGTFSWLGEHFRVGKLLTGEPVGITETAEDDWEIHYGPVQLGTITRRGQNIKLHPVR